MPLSSIAQVLCRLFALQWFLSLVAFLASTGVKVSIILEHQNMGGQWLGLFLHVLPTIVWIAAALALWCYAPAFSKLITKGNDGQVNLGGLTGENLYVAVLMGLGIYFIITSLAPLFPALMSYSAAAKSWADGLDRSAATRVLLEKSRNKFLIPLSPLLCGIVLIAGSRKWGAYLGKKDRAVSLAGD